MNLIKRRQISLVLLELTLEAKHFLIRTLTNSFSIFVNDESTIHWICYQIQKKKFVIIVENILQIFIVVDAIESLKLKIFSQRWHASKNFRSIIHKIIRTRQKFEFDLAKSTNMFILALALIRKLFLELSLFEMNDKYNWYWLRLRCDSELRCVLICSSLNSQLSDFIVKFSKSNCHLFQNALRRRIVDNRNVLLNLTHVVSARRNKTIWNIWNIIKILYSKTWNVDIWFSHDANKFRVFLFEKWND